MRHSFHPEGNIKGRKEAFPLHVLLATYLGQTLGACDLHLLVAPLKFLVIEDSPSGLLL